MTIPPGISYLLTNGPKLCAPAIGAYILNNFVLRDVLEIDLPGWVAAILYLLSAPILFTLSVSWKDAKDSWRARSMGAVMPPLVPNKYPGSIDSMLGNAKKRKIMYPNDLVAQSTKVLGNTINMKLLFTNRFITTEPEYIKLLLATDFEGYEKGGNFHRNYKPLLGSGVFNSDGDMWKFHRGMTRPFFSKDRISHFDLFDRHAEDAVKQMKIRIRQGMPLDIQDVVSRYTLDSATEFLFGNDVHSLSAGLAYPPGTAAPYASSGKPHPANVFADAFLKAQSIASSRSRWDGNWPLLSFWKDELTGEMETVYEFIDPIVERALATKKAGGATKTDEEDRTLLEHLVQLTDDARLIRDETLNIMIAGRDTTASTLTFLVYMLSHHPDVLQRLRKEVIDKLGTTGKPGPEDLRDMKFLRAAINETLRLFPAVPSNVRYARKEALWPSKTGGKPWYIPKGTRCVYSVFLMHRRTDLWGPDALVFDPNRFLDERASKYLTPNPYIFLPFNAGPRICLGQQFAYNEISFMMIRLLQAFSEISWAPDACPSAVPPAEWAAGEGRKANEKLWLKTHLTMYAHNGYWVNMKEASA